MAFISNPKAMKGCSGSENYTKEQHKIRRQCMKTGEQIVEEGCVLLKNDGILPLQTNRVNVFGALSADPFFGGRGSALSDNSKAIGMYTAMEELGLSYNKTLYNLYKNWTQKKRASIAEYPQEQSTKKFKKHSVLSTMIEVFSAPYVKELPTRYLTDNVMRQARSFSDVALVVLGRSGSEQHDMTSKELGLFDTERKLLDNVCANFENVVILLNTAGVLECGFLEEYPQIKGALFIGFPARTGMYSVIRLLKGDAFPSGRTVDTWYYHVKDHPASKNSGSFKYKNAKNRYLLMYKEDIYVGYRYTETFLDQKAYEQLVQFPFGYGLSYTEFSWEDCKVSPEGVASVEGSDSANGVSANAEAPGGDALSVSLRVKNVGARPGKDVVEIYIRPPYTGKIEKAKKVLAAFAKTKLLTPGESQEICLTLPYYDFASYSREEGAYMLEAGIYVAEFSANAHKTKAEVEFSLAEDKFWRQDRGGDIKNRFGAYEGNFRRLSRRDANADVLTGPKESELTAPEEIQNYLKGAYEPRGGEMPTISKDHGVRLARLKGKDYHDRLWQQFVEQFTVDEMIHLITYGGFQTTENKRLGIPETIQSDGPGGIHDSIAGQFGISYPSGTLLASTWNPELSEAFGDCVGAEASFMHVQGWYAPSVNLHRSPYGGRCFEYYSEDPYLSGKIAAGAVRGAVGRGLSVYVKHFALNEEDAHRMNVHTWCSEQAIREIYCKPFEIAVKEGGANGIMSALNCIGAHWCGESEALLNGLLRGEWDFKGTVITDFAGNAYQRSDTGVAAGNDLWLAPMNNAIHVKALKQAYEKDPAGMGRAMQQAVKHICYTVLQTNVELPE